MRKEPKEIVVPNLVGLDPKSAETKARDAGFSMEVLGEDLNLPESPCAVGKIAKQIPSAGEAVYLRQIGITTCVEDSQRAFWEEQQRKKHDEYEKRGYFKEF